MFPHSLLGGVELALNPEEVDLMDTDAMTARAEAALREQQVMTVQAASSVANLSKTSKIFLVFFRHRWPKKTFPTWLPNTLPNKAASESG